MKKFMLRMSIVAAAILAVVASEALPASAVQSPSGCNSNRLNLAIIKDRTSVQQGDTINYTITIANLDSAPAIACDIDAATITVTLPAADGTPTGTVVTLATNASYPAGTPQTTVGGTSYVVNVNPGVTDIVAQARVTGTLHDAPVDHSAEIIKTVGTAFVAATPPAQSGATPSALTPRLPNAGAPHGF